MFYLNCLSLETAIGMQHLVVHVKQMFDLKAAPGKQSRQRLTLLLHKVDSGQRGILYDIKFNTFCTFPTTQLSG